jgi:hypothetical protein
MTPRSVRLTIADAKQHWSVIGRVTKNLLSRDPLCFRKLVKPNYLIPLSVLIKYVNVTTSTRKQSFRYVFLTSTS